MTPVTPGNEPQPVDPCVSSADGSAVTLPIFRRTSPARPQLRAVRGLVSLAALWLLWGCGTGNSFTGGSIPPGGTRLFGRVAAAENPLQPLAHAMVMVETRPISGGVRTLQAVTAADGSFDFTSVPTGSTSTTLTVTVTPDPATSRQTQQMVFRADNGRTDNLVVALPPVSFDVNSARTLTLRDVGSLPPGDSATIHTRLLDSAGKRLPVQPTLLFSGNFGSFAADETFAATATGVGTITAFWYTLPSPSISIVVDANAPQLPPSPPDLPPALTSVDMMPNTPSSR